MKQRYSIVIPIKRYTYFWSSYGIDERKSTIYHDNIKRFFEISWQTHNKNLKKEDIECIFFIVPSDDKVYFESFCSKHITDIHTKIILEEDLIQPKYQFSSHRKQMLLKLLICKYVKTDLHLILDDDIISLKEFAYEDLFHKGKVKYAAEPSIESQPYVWKCSLDLLKLKTKTNIYRLKHTMSITPEIIITSVVKDMMNYLINMHRTYQKLYEQMMSTSWTEYTLYWLYLRYIDKKGISYYYIDCSLTSVNLTVYDENYSDIIRKTMKERAKPFMIIQSNVYEYTIPAIKKALNST